MINRDRLTEHVNLSTLRLELRRAIGPLVMLLIGFAATGGAGYYILQNINGGIGGTHTMKFEVANATGVVPGRAEVRFYGIEAGLVNDVRLVDGHAILTASVANKFGPVYRNAQAAVRPNTALQDMYLDIVNRGTRSAGVAGSGYTVPLSQTTSPTNLADVLNTFKPDVRTQLYNLIDQFGNGLADRGMDLRQAFIELAPFLQIAGNVSKQLAIRATLTKQLVHNASVLSTVLASRSTQLHQLVSAGTQTLQALSTQGGAPMRETISLLPRFTATAHAILEAITSLNPVLAVALHRLSPVVNDLPSGLSDLRALARSADPAVRKLQAPVVKLVPLSNQLQPFSSNLASSLTNISPQVGDVRTVAQDASNCIPWIDEFWNWDASMSKWHDDLGEMVRGDVHFGFYSTFLFKPKNYTYGYQCAGGAPLGAQPTPKYNGPPPAP
jgi:phospholipid/cholesterol/gamma-HCH transport system substrate-binding protein